jgi:single-stranded-DNA-specific exonuclease
MRWSLKPKPDTNTVNSLAKALNIDTVLAGLLVQRGIETFEDAKNFFRPELAHFHDPFLMKDMDKAVQRIEQSLANQENILVYGDYDVDGTTAVALMYSYLKTKTDRVATYIPDRYDEGYGISYQGIDFANDNDFTLIIALDCGIKAIDKVAYANEKNIDFIICDHHRPGDTVPDAIAVLDPKQDNCNYPYKELCGCGVGFKLIQALGTKYGDTIDTLMPYLDLVATAIGADIVPITGENRVLAYHGLEVINANPRTGFKALIAQTHKTELTIMDVVFIIAPRINAAGRMKHGQNAVDLLTETDFETAVKMAQDIEQFNLDRRETDQLITQEALSQIEARKEQHCSATVVYNENWHKGVLGIVASRLIETYYRPTLVFTKSGDKLAASARSVQGFDVYNALEHCKAHIEQFGGHKYAAGLTLKETQYKAFKTAFERCVAETIETRSLSPELTIDCELHLTDITPKFWRILKQFAPFGPGNMTPVFMTKNLQDTGYAKQVGEDGKHLKCKVFKDKTAFNAIGFQLGDKIDVVQNRKRFDAAFTIDENHWNGTVDLQLKLRDIKT